jgi:transcriptional regulator with XRE-family HTH domain
MRSTTLDPVARLEHVIARNVARLRGERGWTQAELARRMSVDAGMAWTPNRCAQVESLRGTVSVTEVATLCWIFEVPMVALLDGEADEAVDLTKPGRTAWLVHFRDGIEGRYREGAAQPEYDAALDRAAAREELRHLARKIGMGDVEDFEALGHALWHRSYLDERERRAGDLTGLTERQRRAKRGHASRAMLSEMETFIEAHRERTQQEKTTTRRTTETTR